MTVPTLQIPRDVIEPIIQAQITAAMTTAFADRGAILEAAVSRVLNEKVDRDGRPCSYGDHTFCQWMTKAAIEKVAKDTFLEVVVQHKEKIRTAMIKELTKNNSSAIKQLVGGLLETVVTENNLKYRMRIEIDK